MSAKNRNVGWSKKADTRFIFAISLIDLQNSFTAANSSKFLTKPIIGYPSHL